MKIRIIKWSLSLLIVLFAPCLSAADHSVSDHFDADLRQWTEPSSRFLNIVKGALTNNTACATSIALKEQNVGDFDLSFRLKLLKGEERQAGQFSVIINRGYGKWVLHFTSNANTAKIRSTYTPKGSKGTRLPFNETITPSLPIDEWIDVAITANAKRYELKVNNEKFILGTAPGSGGITFKSYRQPFALDDFELNYTKPEKLSANLLLNGSFEYTSNPDIPDYWAGIGERYRTNGLPAFLSTAEGLVEYREKFYLDREVAFHGKKSIRVEAPFLLIGEVLKVTEGESYTVSCYIKADSDDQEIRMGVTADAIEKAVKVKVFKAKKGWNRYEMKLPKFQQKGLSFFVKPISSGKIWIDAVQLESGNNATAFMPCWYDTGFLLPESVNEGQRFANSHSIARGILPKGVVPNKEVKLSGVKLVSLSPLAKSYALHLKIENSSAEKRKANVIVCLTAKNELEQLKSSSRELAVAKVEELEFEGFVVKQDQRVCVNVMVLDDGGKIIRQTREFIEVPQPMSIYTDWSYYTEEENAKIIVQFDRDIEKLKNRSLEIEVFAAGYMKSARLKKTFSIKSDEKKQIFTISIKPLRHDKLYTVRATLKTQDGEALMQAETRLTMRRPAAHTEVKVNRINRGIYVNGEPFISYGMLVGSLNEEQLKYYKECGFSSIQFIGHWNNLETNLKFLKNCEKLGIKALSFHVARPYSSDAAEAVKSYSSVSSYVGVVPNDETPDRIAYERTARVKAASPVTLNLTNHNVHSYLAFSNRIEGLPGDVLSIDRYPFIMQPPGRPQTTNDIHSYRLSLELMNRDGRRERKPVFTWLQSSERFSKEPTPQQLTWQTYVALVNHSMGFTYFGAIPNSKRVWERIQSLNREVQSLKPALFSMKEDLVVTGMNEATKDHIRILAKEVNGEYTIICVNNSFHPVDAKIDLSRISLSGKREVEVLFENRSIHTEGVHLLDAFKPFERHVYRLSASAEAGE